MRHFYIKKTADNKYTIRYFSETTKNYYNCAIRKSLVSAIVFVKYIAKSDDITIESEDKK